MPNSSTTTLLTTHHPDYDAVALDYSLMLDSWQGERQIKSKGFTYLPATAGQILDGAMQGNVRALGYQRYLGYLERAVYPGFVERAVSTLVGVLNREDAKIELPSALEPIRENATRRGESLSMLLRRIHENQLLYGRIGLLVDPVQGRQTPILVDYRGDRIVNWSDEPFDTLDPFMLRLVVLDESRPELRGGGFTWEEVDRARVLALADDIDPFLEMIANSEPDRGLSLRRTYRTFVEREGTRGEVIEPRLAGRALPFIPFTVVGSTDLSLEPGVIPLLNLARLCLAIYRGEADYRHGLHLQGQDTLVIIGKEGTSDDPDEAESDDEVRVGAGAQITVPVGGDAKFIGVNPAGLAEQRQAVGDDKRAAQEEGARLLNPQAATAESGEALRIRIAASTATLQSVARTAAAGLQASLRQAAVWVGADPEAVVVTPNLNFAEVRPEPRSLGDLMDAKAKGAPISLQTVHRYAQDGDITKMSFEDEMEALEDEEPEEETEPTETPPAQDDPAAPTEEPDVPNPPEE